MNENSPFQLPNFRGTLGDKFAEASSPEVPGGPRPHFWTLHFIVSSLDKPHFYAFFQMASAGYSPFSSSVGGGSTAASLRKMLGIPSARGWRRDHRNVFASIYQRLTLFLPDFRW
jgi:hypothetical protein